MWEGRKEGRKICKTFPLYNHHLTALLENQHNPVQKKQSGEEVKFMKTEGGGKAAKVRTAMLGIGRIGKKDKTGVLIPERYSLL